MRLIRMRIARSIRMVESSASVASCPEPHTLREPVEDLEMVQVDPWNIRFVRIQTEDLQFLAIEHDPLVVQHILNPTVAVRHRAIKLNPCSIQYLKDPTFKELFVALNEDADVLDDIKPWTFKHFMAFILHQKIIIP